MSPKRRRSTARANKQFVVDSTLCSTTSPWQKKEFILKGKSVKSKYKEQIQILLEIERPDFNSQKRQKKKRPKIPKKSRDPEKS